MPSLSVIIPYHNEGDLVNRALDSVLQQVVAADVEIVLVDDASQIPPPLRNDLAGKVRVLRSETPLYAPGARNLGVRASSGELCCFLDADDAYEPLRLARHLEFLGRHPNVVFAGGQWRMHRGKSWTQVSPLAERLLERTDRDAVLPETARFDICLQSPFTTSAFTVRRWALEQVGGFDESYRWGEEWDLMVRLAQLGPIGYVAHRGSSYYCREGSICTTLNPRKFESGAMMFSKWTKLVAGLPRAYQRRLRRDAAHWWLLAAQTHHQLGFPPMEAFRCCVRSLEQGWSRWGVTSLLRSSFAMCTAVRGASRPVRNTFLR